MTGEKGKDHSDTAKENFVVNIFIILSMVPVYIYLYREMTARHDLEWTPVNIDCELRNTTRIGLMRDYVTCSKFTTKPRLYDIFSDFRCPRVVFSWVFFSS